MYRFFKSGFFSAHEQALHLSMIMMMLWPNLLRADCDVLPELGMLLRLSWDDLASDVPVPTERAVSANMALKNSPIASLAHRLVETGHDDKQIHIIVFLQNMDIVTHMALSGSSNSARTFVSSEGFEATRRNAFHAYNTLCHEDMN